ncbi:hypothetical protein CGRA01v4_12894 [Colletotrichum graminicola]|uniref:Uncharacterized protein n=1 Tax=Colletotrichum graminicola (strain M1.001 / M2 / FGSC 10212) TaxID=645133 RepID=E3QIZ3_COLGM|nr:uncharacterized protein GLRG_05975 [Colletotrichum graminicola M1.001]EFQ30831.1 hypothetical protein GLRG_05975 [Colletotrichum graminicola M1.001]WDK21604.1 hypothetical protein CGRA01v4_12894 [Colletotrichum graminicola]
MEIAASGIAFIQAGVGTGKAILKAIQLWEQVKQLPDDLKARIKRLRSLEPILRQIETEFTKHPDMCVHPTARQSIAYAREAEATLRSHIEKLEGKIQAPKGNFRRRVNSFKIITLKKEEMSMLESELAWAMESVQLAITCFHMAKSDLSERSIINETSARVREYSMACQDDMVKKTAQAVVSMIKVEELSAIDLKPVDFDTSKQTKESKPIRQPNGLIAWPSSFEASVFGRYSFRRSKADNGWTASVQMPWSQRVRELRWTGWQYCFHTYNIRPRSSPAFKAAEKGDLAELMKLFKTGQATPFDRNELGRSLLYLAAKEDRLEVCQALIQQGVPADDERELHGRNPIDAIVTSRNNFTSPTAADATHQALITLFRTAAYGASTLTVERLFAYVAEYSAGDDFIRVYQTQFLRDYHGLPLRDRAEAVRLASFVAHDPRTYRSLLSIDMEITRGDVEESERQGFSLLHSAAIAVGKRMADELQYDPRAFRARSYTEYWSDLIVDTVRAAPEVNSLCHVETVVPWGWFFVPVWRSTPLVSLLGGALCRLSPEVRLSEWESIFQAVLKQWLGDLQSAGVDLLQYGRQEALVQKFTCPEVKGAFDSDAINASRRVVRNELQEASKDSWMMNVDRTFDKSDRYWNPIRIIALDYGPEVDDWRVRWLVESEAFAGEFWRVVEAPRVAMPGSWVD